MTFDTTHAVLRTLRENLWPVERANMLVDTIEGQLSSTRRAAVLLPLFEQEGEICLAFIRRARTLRLHGGEFAFPGGGVDKSDSSPIMTALRETQEEIGLQPSTVEVLGVLSPVCTVMSNYLITPVVGFLEGGLGDVRLQTSEVSELLYAPLYKLVDPAIVHTEEYIRGDLTRTIYFYNYGIYCIWGATGHIINALLERLTMGGIQAE